MTTETERNIGPEAALTHERLVELEAMAEFVATAAAWR